MNKEGAFMLFSLSCFSPDMKKLGSLAAVSSSHHLLQSTLLCLPHFIKSRDHLSLDISNKTLQAMNSIIIIRVTNTKTLEERKSFSVQYLTRILQHLHYRGNTLHLQVMRPRFMTRLRVG